jgi:hypothetical protein
MEEVETMEVIKQTRKAKKILAEFDLRNGARVLGSFCAVLGILGSIHAVLGRKIAIVAV